jgi:hypothetical protein
MNYKDALDHYREKPRKRPAHIVLAFCDRHPLNEVILQDRYRFRLTREITRAEFMATLESNRQRADYVAAEVSTNGARIQIETARDMSGSPTSKYRHFYRAEVI